MNPMQPGNPMRPNLPQNLNVPKPQNRHKPAHRKMASKPNPAPGRGMHNVMPGQPLPHEHKFGK